MADVIELFPLAVATFSERVDAIDESQWSAPTPCDDWAVADLVRHLVDEHRWASPLLHGRDLEAAGRIVAAARTLPDDGGVGANAAQEWREASVASLDVVREPGAGEREVALSRGATPAEQYLTEMIFDLTVHSWDLQQAIGFTGELPAELVAFSMPMADEVGGGQLFKGSVEVDADAPAVDRLVARTGRDPGWSSTKS
jgi:uncharacterized protein (TIGR03086 family)